MRSRRCPIPARTCRWHRAGWAHDEARPPPGPRVLLPRREVAGPALRRRLLHRGAHHRHLLPAVAARPARRRSQNVTFHPTAAAAQAAGYRACKRCLPDATPGSPDWDVAADAAGRAMRLIADGVVDREGVEGLARRVGYTPRHLTRLLTAELGAGPLALARARRAQTARVLIETTDLRFADVAFAAGFSSIRQFNDTVREVYAATPTELRGRRGGPRSATGHGDDAARRAHAVRRPGAARLPRLPPGRRASRPPATGWYARTLDLPHGPGTVRLELADAPTHRARPPSSPRRFALHDLRDTAAAVERARRLRRRRLRPDRRRRPLRRRPGDRPARPRAPRAARARPGRRRRDRDPHRHRPAGQRGRRLHGHRPARRRARPAGRDRRSPGSPTCSPTPATLAARRPRGRCRCRGPAAGR